MERRLWKLVALATGAAAAAAVRQGAAAAWRVSRHDEPPEHLSARGVSLRDALVWAVALGVGAAVAKVLAERAAAIGWEKAVGSPPPDPAG